MAVMRDGAGASGFGLLSGDAPPPFPRGKLPGGIGRPGEGTGPAPPSAPSSSPVPASTLPAQITLPYGQANDPGAYGTPGASSSSPLGMWQNWLNTMGPYLAQLPGNQPQAESGGLSSLNLNPSPTGPGLAGYGGGLGTGWQGGRGFREMMQ